MHFLSSLLIPLVDFIGILKLARFLAAYVEKNQPVLPYGGDVVLLQVPALLCYELPAGTNFIEHSKLSTAWSVRLL